MRTTRSDDKSPFEASRLLETCTKYLPNRVRFAVENGTEVQHIIGIGPDGEMYMTYAFSWKREVMVPGSESFMEEEARTSKCESLVFFFVRHSRSQVLGQDGQAMRAHCVPFILPPIVIHCHRALLA